MYLAKAYSEPCQASKKKRLATLINGFQSLTIFLKCIDSVESSVSQGLVFFIQASSIKCFLSYLSRFQNFARKCPLKILPLCLIICCLFGSVTALDMPWHWPSSTVQHTRLLGNFASEVSCKYFQFQAMELKFLFQEEVCERRSIIKVGKKRNKYFDFA